MANGYGSSSGSSSSSSSSRTTTGTRRIIPIPRAQRTTPITTRTQRRTVSTAQQTPIVAANQQPPAPEGFHYMPDGTLMSNAEHAALYGEVTQSQTVKSTQHD